MPVITPDFSEASDQPIQAGTYNARILKSEQRTSQNGNDYIKWTLSLFGCEGEYAALNNRYVWYNTMLSGRGASMLKKFVKAATGETPPAEFDTDSLVGKEVCLVLVPGVDQQGNPSDYPDVKAVTARG